MAQRKPCTAADCDEPKMRGNAAFCVEDWLAKQPMQVQIKHADLRLSAVPVPLRLPRVPAEQWPEGRRWCAGCQSFMRLKDVTGSRCKACNARASREYRLETEYSLTPQEYQLLFEAQHGRCYLCHKKSPSRPLAVDHDHETGEVRGLLCPDPDWGCNLKVVARADASPGGLVGYALRMLNYARNPPARSVLKK
jgi:hypothetical protein